MNVFRYLDGELHADEVPIRRIAEQIPTPFYCYVQRGFEEAFQEYRQALDPLGVRICYAIKANHHTAVIRIFREAGAWAEIVSAGELLRANEAGIEASQVIFAGVGKQDAEIRRALGDGIFQFNVESPGELERLDALARAMGKRAPVALRVNPDVDANTHDKISTGRKGDKFGIPIGDIMELAQRTRAMAGVELKGLAMHIGSQLLDLTPLEQAFRQMRSLWLELQRSGCASLSRLDLGGGVGVDYSGAWPGCAPPIKDLAHLIRTVIGDLGCELFVEPGRRLTAGAGVLVTRVIERKMLGQRACVVVDAAMNDLARPALYGAQHPVWGIGAPEAGGSVQPVDLVGPVCESSDVFCRGMKLPELARGDLLAFGMAGAYGSVMGSGYNSRDLCAEVLVHGERFEQISRPLDVVQMMARERWPGWLEPVVSGPGQARV